MNLKKKKKKNKVTFCGFRSPISFRNEEDTSVNLYYLQFPGKTFSQSARHRGPLQDSSTETCRELNFNSRTVGEIIVIIMSLNLSLYYNKTSYQSVRRTPTE